MSRIIDQNGLFAARALATVSLTALLVVSACDQAPAPEASNTQAPPAPPSADLMGAPQAPPPSAEGPAPPAYAPPPSPTQAPTVTMQPIPNPGDPGSEAYYPPASRRVHSRFIVAQSAPAASSEPVAQAAPPTTAPVHRAPPRYGIPGGRPATASSAVAASGAKVKPAVPAKVVAAHPAAKTHPGATVPQTVPVPVSAAASPMADLQTTLTNAIGQSAVLTAPDQFVANQPADVTLSIPAGFGDTLHDTAKKDGLTDAAASASVAAVLSGQGYTVIPQEAQSVPLVIGKPTDFHWTVTAQPNAKGPLHADVSATLLGGGSKVLPLGAVQKPVGGLKLTPRIVGASLLFLIGGLVVAWLARGRGSNQSMAARKAAKRAARSGRPLNMGGGDPPSV